MVEEKQINLNEIEKSVESLIKIGFDEIEARELLLEMLENDIIIIERIKHNIYNNKDFEARADLHTIIGSAGNLRFFEIVLYANSIRDAINKENKELALELLNLLREFCKRTILEIKK